MRKDILELYGAECGGEKDENKSSRSHKKKCCKKTKKLLKKQNKYLKQLTKACKFQEGEKQNEAYNDRGEEKNHKENTDGEQQERDKQSKKSFWSKLGDAIIKAVPVILTTITAAVCSFFFGGKYRSGSTRYGWSMG